MNRSSFSLLSLLLLFLASFSINAQVQYEGTINTGPLGGNGRGSTSIIVYEDIGRAYVANIGSENISIVDLETRSVIDVVGVEYPLLLCKNPSNASAYVRTIDGLYKLSLLDNSLSRIGSPGYVDEFRGQNQMLHDPTLDRIIITGNNSITVFDAQTDLLVNTIVLPNRLSTLALDPLHDRIISGSNAINNLYVLDYETLAVEDTIITNGKISKLFYDNLLNQFITFEWERDAQTQIGWSSVFTYSEEFSETGQIMISEDVTIESWAHYASYDEAFSRLFLSTLQTGGILVDISGMSIIANPNQNQVIGTDLYISDSLYYSVPSQYISIVERGVNPSPWEEYVILGYGMTDVVPNEIDNTMYTIEEGAHGGKANLLQINGNNYSIMRDIEIDASTERGFLELIDNQYLIISRNHYFDVHDLETTLLINSIGTSTFDEGYEISGLTVIPNSTNVILTGSGCCNYGDFNTRVISMDFLSGEILGMVDIPDDPDSWDGSDIEYVEPLDVLINISGVHLEEPGTSESNNITIIDASTLQIDTTIYLPYSPWLHAINTSSADIYIHDMDNGKIHKYSDQSYASINIAGSIAGMSSNPVTQDLYLLRSDPSRIVVLDSNLVNVNTIDIPGNPPIRYEELFRYNNKSGDIYITSLSGAEIFVFNDKTARLVPELAAPEDVEILVGDRQLTINWNEVNEPIVGYNIYRNTPPEVIYIKANSTTIIDTIFTDLELTNGSSYSYKVVGVDEWNIEGIYSASIQAIPIDLPGFQLIPQDYSLPLSVENAVTFNLNIIREAQFTSHIAFLIPNQPDNLDFQFAPNPALSEENVSLTITADASIELGTYYFEVWAQGGGQTEIVELSVMVSNGYSLSLHADPLTQNMYEPITLFGLLDPGEGRSVSYHLTGPQGSTSQLNTQTDPEGNYQVQFIPEKIGSWQIYSKVPSLNNMTSDTLSVEVLKASSRISCTTDLVDSAEVGWAMTIKGQVYPPPGVGTGSLQVMKPDSSIELIDGVLINEQGYYGHNISANQTGLWTINASWSGNDTHLGAESNTLKVPVGLGVGLGIIVRAETNGFNPDYDRSLDSLSSFSYQVLTERRFTDGMIYYLNPDQSLDLNNDGFADEVDDQPTLLALEYAITTWAKVTVNDSVSLSLYMVGPGSTDGFQINQTQVLTPVDLNTWLTELEDSTGTHINVIFETDQGLGLTDALSNQSRTILSSTDTTSWNAYDSGQISFSRLFWNGIFTGMSVGEAFLTTKDQMVSMPELFRNQLPQIESNGTLIHNEQNDYDLAGNVYLGGTYLLGDFPPDMVGGGTTEGGGGLLRYSNPALPYQTSLSRATTFGIRLWSQINDEDPDELNVRALVSAPGSERVSSQSMSYAGDGIYEAYFTEFDGPGMYDIFIYATDQSGHMSSPIRKQLFLTEVNLDFIAPDLGIGLLQNPLFDDYLDLYVLSSETLIQTPTAEVNGVSLILAEAPQLSQNAYYSQIIADASGQSTIQVVAEDLNSNQTTSNLSFRLSKVLARRSSEIDVPESSVNLSIPEGAVFMDSKLLLTSRSPSDLMILAPLNTNYSINDSSITPVHIFTADFRSNLESPITLKTDPMTNLDATFYEVTSQGWLALDTYVDDEGLRWAFTDHEGTFALARGNDKAIYVPTALKLNQNYPNPFNASTMFEFEIPSGYTWAASGSRQVQLDVYNILGQQIVTLINSELSPGQYQVSWSGLDVQGKLMSSGVYFARLSMGDKLITNKMLLLK